MRSGAVHVKAVGAPQAGISPSRFSPSSGRSLWAEVGLTGPAVAFSSAAGMGTLLLIGRSLAPAAYATFGSWWALLFLTGSLLAALEPEVARAAASGAAVARMLRTILPVLAVALALAALTVAALSGPVIVHLLGGHRELLAPLAVGTGGFAGLTVMRGWAVGRGRIRRYALLLAAEAGIRLVAVAALAAANDLTLRTSALAVSAGSFVWLAVLPGAARRRGRPSPGQQSHSQHVHGAGGPAGAPALDGEAPGPGEDDSSTRQLLALLAAGAATAVLVTGLPALLAASTGPTQRAALGGVLAALTLSRVPLLAFAPVQALLVPRFVAAARAGATRGSGPGKSAPADGTPRGAGARSYRLPVLLGAGVGATMLLAFGAGGLGPVALRVLYGPGYRVSGELVAALMVAACLQVALLAVAAFLVAHQAHRSVTVAWWSALAATVATLAGVGACGAGVGARTGMALLAGMAVGLAVAVRAASRARR